jgi:4-hydroxy-4-methyl-2-oxoglutarate aldolase
LLAISLAAPFFGQAKNTVHEWSAMKTDASAMFEQLRSLTTCLVASAIETFRVRLPNTGFVDSSVRCIFQDQLSLVGYAATARIRSSNPPMEGEGYSYERTDWWNHILSIPAPRIVVIEDLDEPAGIGAFVGEVNANILLALECAGLVTNGGVRDLNEVRPTGFQMFAGNVSVSHAYSHILDFGGPVVVGGLGIRPGDLIHADCNGVQTIPLEIAPEISHMARKIQQRRQKLVALCRSTDFSLEVLRKAIEEPELQS